MKPKHSPKIILLLMLLTYSIPILAQSDTIISRHIKALENYALNKPIEKVHLHLDRQFYFPGDTIWFKAYTVIGPEHKLSALSIILYVELISPKDTLLKRLTLGLQDGAAPGDFELAYDAPPGLYRIRAYTNWMRNFGQEYFFDELINVSGFNTLPGVTSQVSGSDKIDLQFFPEGGSLVSGLRSKIAFKAVNQDGVAEEVQGSIQDNNGNEVATFNSQHLGMGVFPLLPEPGKQYVAKVTDADGSRFTVSLPAVKDAGFTLTINNNIGDSVYIKIAAKNVKDTAFYLLAQSDGKYYYAAAHKLDDKIYTEALEKSRFPTGLIQFTLFGQNGEPLNQRAVFIQNEDQLKANVSTDKQSYAPGEQVKLNIEAKDQDNQLAPAVFSAAVVDESKVSIDEAAEPTILTDLLLQSETGTHIQDPGYYFIDPNEKTKADLDLLLLTQAYHRFDWKKILAGTDSITYQPEQGFTVSGTVTTPGGKSVPNGKVILTSTKNRLVLDTVTDRNGKFAFNDLQLPDTTKLVITAKKANDKENVVLAIDKQSFPPITPFNRKLAGYIINHFRPDAELVKQAYTAWKQDSIGHVIQLNEVKVKDKKIPPYHPDYSVLLKYSTNLNGPGQANQVIMGDEFKPGCVNISMCLASLLRGGVRLVMDSNGTATIFSTRTPIALSGGTKPMAVLLDGVIMSQDEAFKMVTESDIQSVEALESYRYIAIYGSAASGGLLIITTKKGDEPNNIVTLRPYLTVFDFKGFYKPHQFYSPKYTANHTVTLADNRRTVLWANLLPIDKNGLRSLDYFNAGDKGNCRVAIEGIDGEGRMVRQVLTYKVELNN